MKSRVRHRALAAWAVASFALFALAPGCEPRDIYLFDDPPAQTRADAGARQSESEPPEREGSEDASGPEDSSEPEDSERASEQPDCRSAACRACVEESLCAGQSAVHWCHPETGACLLACDPSVPAAQAGRCPPPQRCNPELGLCVACVSNDDCGAPLPVCDPSLGVCVECSSNSDCAAGAATVCALPERRCVQCQSNADCAGFEEDPVCLLAERRCVECLADADCTSEPDRPFCSSENECEDGD